MQQPIFDRAVIDELREILGEGFAALRERFASDGSLRLTHIAQALQQQDADALCQQAHSLKGAAANLGANGLADSCAALETAAKTADWPAAEEQLSRAKQLFAEALPLLADD